MGNCHSFTEFFRLKFGKKDTLLGLENEHCLKIISVDGTIMDQVPMSLADYTALSWIFLMRSTILKWVYLCKY